MEKIDNETKKEVDNGAGKPFRSQRDNKEKPSSACNVTSMIIALCAAGWPVDKFSKCNEQPEDLLMRFIYSDQATLQRWKQIDPQGKIPPNQWHAVLAYATGRFLKSFGYDATAVTWRDCVNIEEIVAAIDAGGAAVVSGEFRQNGKPLHHIVAAVGYGENKDGFYFIIDDPWGNHKTDYKDHNGKGVRLPLADFTRIMKPRSGAKKWAHLIKKFK
ncbi:MAG: C39 family peptidase [Treponema sp.]|nr:C39 family peptidase [Treponema sp.]